MEGMTGRLFREFSIVISGSVIISSFAALTFTPMLATKLLVKREKQNWFYLKTEPFFEGMNRLYSRSLAVFLHKRWIALPFVAITIGIIASCGITSRQKWLRWKTVHKSVSIPVEPKV